MSRLPFDPIDEAARQWGQRWPGVPAMHAVTSLMRVQQLVLGRLERAVVRRCGRDAGRRSGSLLPRRLVVPARAGEQDERDKRAEEPWHVPVFHGRPLSQSRSAGGTTCPKSNGTAPIEEGSLRASPCA